MQSELTMLRIMLPRSAESDDFALGPKEDKNDLDEISSRAQLTDIFRMLPRSILRRAGGEDGDNSSVAYAVGGVNPRSSSYLLNLCNSHPCFVKLVTSFVRLLDPQHKFSSFVIRRGCYSRVHRDSKNGPYPSLVVSLSTPALGDGLWIDDKIGGTLKEHLGQSLPGTIVPLDAPFVFDARKVLHAGHMSNPELASSRIVLVAFTTLNARFVEPRVKFMLEDLGFPLPQPGELSMHDRSRPQDDVPRLRQLSVREAFNLPSRVGDLHDVIEVLDSQ